MWHASVALLGKHGPVQAADLSPSNQRVLVKVAKSLIAHVGQLPSAVEQMGYAVHYRRAISDFEYGLLPEVWCGLPAVHEAGHGVLLETNT